MKKKESKSQVKKEKHREEIAKDLYESEKEKGIRSKENDPDEIIQENFSREIWAGVEGKDSIFGPYQTDKIDGLEELGKPEIEINVNKDEEREDKEILDILEVLMKKEKLARDGEPTEGTFNIDNLNRIYDPGYCYQNGIRVEDDEGRDNNRAVGVNDCIDGDKLLIEEKEEIIDNKKELTEKKLNYVCELWSEKVTKFRQRVEWDKNDRLKKEYWYLNDLETGIDDNKAKSLDKKMGDTDETIVGKEDNSEDDDGKKLLGRSLIVLLESPGFIWKNELETLKQFNRKSYFLVDEYEIFQISKKP
ncbi:hypothetical protein C2G38_2232723 [Gigaspora rosea]|uniref:Uncharacterized protein n=1 Tax=Gigaspora rosea TaxID=44941 RepID=A0A397TRR2_9GLOM|nr:hypothetical protein C2G38_2232723 [Gigaspora rosea]